MLASGSLVYTTVPLIATHHYIYLIVIMKDDDIIKFHMHCTISSVLLVLL